jgi:hypothetical protein
MPIHDRYARRTPFERGLPDAQFPVRRFPDIEREAEERDVGLTDPGAFGVLESAGEALDEMRGPDEGMETLPAHAAFLFHAFHHHRAGRPLVLVRAAVVRRVVGAEPGVGGSAGGSDGESVGLPACAYVQLPQHLVWARDERGETPRSVDGFFWTLPGDGSVHALAVAALLDEGPGFTALPVPPVPQSDIRTWAGMSMRGEGAEDFVPSMPGAELEGLFELRTTGELLKLGARLDAWLQHHPEALHEPDAPPDPAGPWASELPYRLLTLE